MVKVRKAPRRFGATLRLTCVAVSLAGCFASASVFAAMNFCAAPALQGSEKLSTDPGIRALLDDATRHLDDQPKARAHLHLEGSMAGQPEHDDSVLALQDMPLMRNAALAWRVSGDERYLRLVVRLLDAWVDVYQPSFNPIDESSFGNLILAFDLSASALPVKTRNNTLRFLTTLGRGYIAQIAAQPRPLSTRFSNGWQSQRVKLVAMTAFALDDRKMIDAAQQLFEQQIAANISPEGATLDFVQRDALREAVHDLQPLVMAALAARRHNRNWLRLRADNEASLSIGLDWLTPYALGRVSHEEFAHSTQPDDLQKHGSGVAGFNGSWDPAEAAELYYLAARLNDRYQPVALHLAPRPPAWLAVCLPVPA